MKIAIKHENDKFMVITLKHVSGLMVVKNRTITPKPWAIAHENSYKRENNEFLVISLKPVSGLMVVVNRLGTRKLWVITRKNGHKTIIFWS